MTLKIWNCLKCNYEWASRLEHQPRYCARCGKERWDKPITPREQSIRKAKPRVKKYDLSGLMVGSKILFPYKFVGEDLVKKLFNVSMGKTITAEIRLELENNDKVFYQWTSPSGITVMRVR